MGLGGKGVTHSVTQRHQQDPPARRLIKQKAPTANSALTKLNADAPPQLCQGQGFVAALLTITVPLPCHGTLSSGSGRGERERGQSSGGHAAPTPSALPQPLTVPAARRARGVKGNGALHRPALYSDKHQNKNEPLRFDTKL